MTEEKKELEIPMTGTEVMQYISIDASKMFFLIRERLLLPRYPKDLFRIKLEMSSRYDSPESYLSKWTYWKSDVEKFKKKNRGWLKKVKLTIVSAGDKEIKCVQPEESTDPETFIRAIQFSYVSDTEIRIKGGGKNAKTYEKKELGFNKTNSKIWNAFINILTSQDHMFHVGTARGAKGERKQSYDSAQKTLLEINKKIISFLNEKFQAQLPKGFKAYELIPEKKEAPGTYRFKFKIINNNDADIEKFKALTKDELLQQIEILSQQKKRLSKKGDDAAGSKFDKISNQLSFIVEIACKKGLLTPNRAKYYLNPTDDTLPNEPSIKDEDPIQED